MAFTFQKNTGVRFRHDEHLLAKAESLRPGLIHTEVHPVSLAELQKDEHFAGGWKCVTKDGDYQELLMGRDDSIILDFGAHEVGSPALSMESVGSPMDAPLTLSLKFAEIPFELAADSSEYTGWLSRSWIQEETVHVDTLPHVLRLSRRYSFRYLKVTVVDTSPKWKVRFRNIICDAVSSVPGDFPEKPEVREVIDRDPLLAQIYKVSARTLHECMQDVFEDGPKRDRRLWIGDLRLQALADYATYDSTNLVKRCLYLFAGCAAEDGRIAANIFTNPSVIPDDTFLFDYSLFFISILEDYLECHEDPELLSDLYPAAKAQMDYALRFVDSDGKLAVPDSYPLFIDWGDGFDRTTAGQGVMICALKQFLKLPVNTDRHVYQDVLKSMTSYARDVLYDSTSHLFVSGDRGEINLASQAWMALAHVLTDQENKVMMETAVSKLFPIHGIATPYMYHYVTQALFEAGLSDEAVYLMKSYWGKMIELGADTFWEAFDPDHPDYSPYGSPIVSSYCHAWACTPVWLIQKYLA